MSGPSSPSHARSGRLVAVAVFAHAVEAHLARARLEAEGIEAALVGEHVAGVLVGVQSVSVHVPASDAERARAVLAAAAEMPDRPSADWVTDELDAPRCPACGSLRVVFERALWPFPALRRRARCERCGESWRDA